MKTAVAAVCAVLSFCVCADVYDWTGSGGNTVAAACSFSDKDNWRNASVPVSAAGSDIFFTNIVGSLCFVDLPGAFAFRRITGAIGFPVVLLGSSVTSSNGFGSFGSGTAPAVYCYSDLTAGGSLYLNRSVLCGDVVAGEGKTVCTDTGESYHRLDLYANSA